MVSILSGRGWVATRGQNGHTMSQNPSLNPLLARMGCNFRGDNALNFHRKSSQSSPGEDWLQQTLFTHICKKDAESQSSTGEDGVQPRLTCSMSV